MKREKDKSATLQAVKWAAPKIGERRTKKRFAWWPTITDSGHIVWLEFYLSYEEYCHTFQGYKWVAWKRTPIN